MPTDHHEQWSARGARIALRDLQERIEKARKQFRGLLEFAQSQWEDEDWSEFTSESGVTGKAKTVILQILEAHGGEIQEAKLLELMSKTGAGMTQDSERRVADARRSLAKLQRKIKTRPALIERKGGMVRLLKR